MKKTIYTIPLLLILVATSCKKVKLEDEKGMLLIGKWQFQYTGAKEYTWNGLTEFRPLSSQYNGNFIIDLSEEGKIIIEDKEGTKKYRIRDAYEVTESGFDYYGLWRYRIHYGKESEHLYFDLHYFEDSILVDKLPTNMFLSTEMAGNVFYKTE